MTNAALLEKIKNKKLCPPGSPSFQLARVAIDDLNALPLLKGLDAKVLDTSRRELIQYIAAYRRTLKHNKAKRRKHTRG